MINSITRGLGSSFYGTKEDDRDNYNPSEGKRGLAGRDSVKVFMIRYWEVERQNCLNMDLLSS